MRFASDTSRHQMTIHHDDGVYRHLRYTSNPTGYGEYWFDLITWPGRLAIVSDVGDDYVFTRHTDMFEFFRGRAVNPHYWSEKLGGGRRSVQEYSEDVFRQVVRDLFVDAVRYGDAPRGLGQAVREGLLNQDTFTDREARELLEAFEYRGFRFKDTWEYSFRDYEPAFLWCCHAIVWGIARYDRLTRGGLQNLATPTRAKAA